MYRSILLPLDGSEFAEHAVAAASAIARRDGARVNVVHVHEPLFGELDEELQAQERDYLATMAGRISEATGGEVTHRNLVGRINEQLQAYVQQTRADLVVMTTHGRGGVTRAWLGSSADAMVRESRIPVLLVRPEKRGDEEVAKERFERILIPLDGSKPAEQIVAHAVAVGGKEASYELVKVTSPDNVSPEDAKGYGFQTGQDSVVLERKRVKEYLEGIAGKLREEGYDVSTDVIGALRPARGILDHAAESGADLIAIATQGRGGLRRLLIGSVADKVLRGAEVSVLAYRPVEA